MKTSTTILFQCFALSLLAGCATQNKTEVKAESTAPAAVAPAPEPKKNPPDQIDYTQINPPSSGAVIQTGRYMAVPTTPTLAQRDPLQVVITVTIPSDLTTVGQAVHYLLRRSGYGVETPARLNPDALRMFLNPLPEVQRRIGPMTLRDALTILVTPEFVPVVDPIRRRINYEPTLVPEEKSIAVVTNIAEKNDVGK